MVESAEAVTCKKSLGFPVERSFFLSSPAGTWHLAMFRSGRFTAAGGGGSGFWASDGSSFRLQPDDGPEIVLQQFQRGYRCKDWLMVPSDAEFVEFWRGFDPSQPIYSALRSLDALITSTWRGTDLADLVISGENAKVQIEDGAFHWKHNGRGGRANWFVGVPFVGSPRALHVPHFYDYWGRLGDLRPERRPPARGISWVASYYGNRGGLTERRVEVARQLSRWFPLAVNSSVRGAFAGNDNVTAHEVPWGLLGKYDFISGYSFNLCFENSLAKGYLTEKPFDALIAGAVPLYEGDPDVAQWIDPTGMIDCTGLAAEEIADRIRQAELDGLPERVWTEREKLVKVSLDQMLERIDDFVDRIQKRTERSSPVPAAVLPREDTGASGSSDAELSRITVVIKTILRPQALRNAVRSFQAVLGDQVTIVVVDDSPEPDGSDLPPQVRFIPLPFDTGLSAGRNRGVNEAETDIVFLADDDVIVHSSKEEILSCIKLLDQGWDLVGSCAFDFKEDGGKLTVTRKLMRGTITRCEVTKNFFLAKTSVLKQWPWDERMKLHPEHEDFFLRLRAAGVKVGGTPLLRLTNLSSRTPEYSALRRRSFMPILTEVWGFNEVHWDHRMPRETPPPPAFEEGECPRVRISGKGPALEGWFNLGATEGAAWRLAHDSDEPLPFLPGQLEFVAVDRLIETMTHGRGADLLAEVFKVLKPGGKIRVTTADLGLLTRLGSGADLALDEEGYLQWISDKYLPEIPCHDPVYVINYLMRSAGRVFLHNEGTLSLLLEEVGFAGISRARPGTSKYGEFWSIEDPHRLPRNFCELETLILEAVKPRLEVK